MDSIDIGSGCPYIMICRDYGEMSSVFPRVYVYSIPKDWITLILFILGFKNWWYYNGEIPNSRLASKTALRLDLILDRCLDRKLDRKLDRNLDRWLDR